VEAHIVSLRLRCLNQCVLFCVTVPDNQLCRARCCCCIVHGGSFTRAHLHVLLFRQATDTQSIQALLSNYLASTAFSSLYRAKLLSGVVTPSMLPPQVPLKLNTTFFKTFLPALYKAFPNRPFDLVVRWSGMLRPAWRACVGMGATPQLATLHELFYGGVSVCWCWRVLVLVLARVGVGVGVGVCVLVVLACAGVGVGVWRGVGWERGSAHIQFGSCRGCRGCLGL